MKKGLNQRQFPQITGMKLEFSPYYFKPSLEKAVEFFTKFKKATWQPWDQPHPNFCSSLFGPTWNFFIRHHENTAQHDLDLD